MKHAAVMVAAMAAALALSLSTPAVAGEVEIVNDDSFFPEGPVWKDGTLYYVEYSANTIMMWDGSENVELWKQDGCGPSAVAETADGNFIVTCYDSNSLAVVSAEGETLNSIDQDAEGNPFVGPNDLEVDAKGGIYFSASGVWDVAAPIDGRIFYIDPEGTVAEVANDIHYSNGLALSNDGSILYASEMAAQRVLMFEVNDDGSLGSRYLFARLADIVPDPDGVDIYMGPDGLKVDSEGNIYIAQFEGSRVIVASPDGELVRTLDVPAAYVTNLTFGETEEVVYITAATDAWTAPYPGQVYRVENR